jgi:hypothetical protein
MFHGHASMGDGPSVTGIFFFIWFCASLVIAYGAMKIAAGKREAREKANKSLKNRLTKGQ